MLPMQSVGPWPRAPMHPYHSCIHATSLVDPSPPSLSPSPPHHRHPHRPPHRRHLPCRPYFMLPPGKMPLPPSPPPPPPSPPPLHHVHHPLRFAALTIATVFFLFALSLTPTALTTTLPPSPSQPALKCEMDAMRVRALATCVHAPARLPSVRTAPTLHAHHATSWPSPCTTLTLFASLSGRSQCELSNEVR